MKLELNKSAQKDLDKLPDQTVLRIKDKLLKLTDSPYGPDSVKLGGDKG